MSVVSFSVQVSGDTTLVAGVGGQQITVTGMKIRQSGGVLATLKGTSGKKVEVVPSMDVEFDYWAAKAPVSDGLVINLDRPNIPVVGTLTYSQA